MNWLLLKNSLLVSGSVTLLAVSCGVVAALCLAGLPRGWRTAGLALAITALALPPFLSTNSWLDFLGPTGVWRSWLPFNIVSFAGTVWILTLLLWPISMLLVLGAWRRLEPAQLESDMAVRGWSLLRGLLLPLAKPALALAAPLTFILALNNFAVPAILQVKTFPAEVWIRFSTSFDTPGSLMMSLPMMVAALLVLLWFTRGGLPWPHVQTAVSPALFRQQVGPIWYPASGVATVVLAGLSAVLPLLQILTVHRTWTELPGALEASQTTIWYSFWLAAAAATVAVLVSLAGAAALQFRNRTGAKALRSFLGWVLWVPFLLPGVLLGIGLIAVFNRPWSMLFYQSAGIVILAWVVRYLALSWHLVGHAADSADRDLLDVARVEGASFRQILRHVYWPQIAPLVAAVWYVFFLLCLWDVETIILIIPPEISETLALRIFNLLHYGHNAQVNALCLTLLGVALVPLIAWAAWRGIRRAFVGVSRASRLPAVSATVLTAGILSLFTACERRPAALLHSKLFSAVKIIGTRGVGVGQLNKPRSLAIGADDSLYVVDMTGRVQKFSSNGVFQLLWQMPETQRGKPKGMCRDHEGNIVVVEPHYSRVNHFSPEGKLVRQWGHSGTNDGQFWMPRAVAVDSKNELFITEYLQRERVQKFLVQPGTNAPVWVATIGKAGTGPGEFNRPEGICVDRQDRVYVADSCNHRIQVFSPDGKFLRMYGQPGKGLGELSYPYDICVDPQGRQYVCEFGNSRIQVFDAHDRPIEIIGGRGAEPGRFSNPWSIALDSAGNLYVADSQNHRVQKLIRNPDSWTVKPARLESAGTRRGNPRSENQPRKYVATIAGRFSIASDARKNSLSLWESATVGGIRARDLPRLRIFFPANGMCALLRPSDFGLLSDFGFRVSGFASRAGTVTK